MRTQHRQRDRPTCKQCKDYRTRIESSRRNPCKDFLGRKKSKQITDGQLAVVLAETGLIFCGMVAIYIARG